MRMRAVWGKRKTVMERLFESSDMKEDADGPCGEH